MVVTPFTVRVTELVAAAAGLAVVMNPAVSAKAAMPTVPSVRDVRRRAVRETNMQLQTFVGPGRSAAQRSATSSLWCLRVHPGCTRRRGIPAHDVQGLHKASFAPPSWEPAPSWCPRAPAKVTGERVTNQSRRRGTRQLARAASTGPNCANRTLSWAFVMVLRHESQGGVPRRGTPAGTGSGALWPGAYPA